MRLYKAKNYLMLDDDNSKPYPIAKFEDISDTYKDLIIKRFNSKQAEIENILTREKITEDICPHEDKYGLSSVDIISFDKDMECQICGKRM